MSNPNVVNLARMQDQRKAILDAVGHVLHKFDPIYGNDVLTATYIEPEVTAGGIIMPEQRLNESVYQGKVGLVLKLGVDAFKFREGFSFFAREAGEGEDEYRQRVAAMTPRVGDWVFYRPVGNLWKCTINGFACQFVRDSEIKGRVTDPEVIF